MPILSAPWRSRPDAAPDEVAQHLLGRHSVGAAGRTTRHAHIRRPPRASSPTRSRRRDATTWSMKWVYRILLVLLGAAILSAAVLSSRGSFQRVNAPGRDATTSAAALWRICLSRQPRRDRKLVDRCVRGR